MSDGRIKIIACRTVIEEMQQIVLSGQIARCPADYDRSHHCRYRRASPMPLIQLSPTGFEVHFLPVQHRQRQKEHDFNVFPLKSRGWVPYSMTLFGSSQRGTHWLFVSSLRQEGVVTVKEMTNEITCPG